MTAAARDDPDVAKARLGDADAAFRLAERVRQRAGLALTLEQDPAGEHWVAWFRDPADRALAGHVGGGRTPATAIAKAATATFAATRAQREDRGDARGE